MSLFGIWSEFGFRENPYSQDTLPADASGDYLLTGRDEIVEDVQRRIGSGGTHPAIEGPVGVGKSSLLKVAAYRMAKRCMDARSRELYLPASRFFEASRDVDEFEGSVYRTVAQTLIQNAGSFSHVGLDEPELDALDRWINAAQYESWSAGASVVGSGGNVGRGSEPNTSEGFTLTGFRDAIRRELERCFPAGTGGIICVLDNMELLETTGEARSTLDALRDRLFNVPQLRWVLCGSRGIVSRARTERLSGVFQEAIFLPPLDEASVVEAIRRRIDYFGDEASQPPVTPGGFDFLYRALNLNLRDALSTAQEFAQWLYGEYRASDRSLPGAADRDALLQVWLASRAERAFNDARDVQTRVWQFFVDLASRGGRAGSAEYRSFGFEHQQQMVSAVGQLMDANLAVRETDPDHGAKTVNSVTALGWLVYFHRNNYELPPPRATAGSS